MYQIFSNNLVWLSPTNTGVVIIQLKLFIVFWKLFINVELDNWINNQGWTFASFASAVHVLLRIDYDQIFLNRKPTITDS